jgi:hypothetical protein
VPGRLSGRTTRFPLLGESCNWVRNVRAAGGRVTLHRGRRTVTARLTEVPAAGRAPVLKRYLAVAPGGRPHLPVDRGAPLVEFAAIAADYPVFRIAGGPTGR